MKIKKLSIVLAFLFITLFFAGCAETGYGISIFEDGRIRQTFYVELNEQLITDAGYDLVTTKNTITNAINDMLYGETGLVTLFEAVDHGENALQDAQIEEYIKQGIGSITEEDGAIGITLMFNSYEDFSLFYRYDVEEPEPNEELVEENLFYIKTTTYSSTIYKNVPESNLLITFLNMFNTQPTIFNLNDVTFYHNYATYQTKLRSNADRVYYSNGLKVHSWEVNANNLDREIEFYEFQVITVWWYILAMGLTFAFLIIILFLHMAGVAKRKVKQSVINATNSVKNKIKTKKNTVEITTREKFKNKFEEINLRKKGKDE